MVTSNTKSSIQRRCQTGVHERRSYEKNDVPARFDDQRRLNTTKQLPVFNQNNITFLNITDTGTAQHPPVTNKPMQTKLQISKALHALPITDVRLFSMVTKQAPSRLRESFSYRRWPNRQLTKLITCPSTSKETWKSRQQRTTSITSNT